VAPSPAQTRSWPNTKFQQIQKHPCSTKKSYSLTIGSIYKGMTGGKPHKCGNPVMQLQIRINSEKPFESTLELIKLNCRLLKLVKES
jgi:hypothetical protein